MFRRHLSTRIKQTNFHGFKLDVLPGTLPKSDFLLGLLEIVGDWPLPSWFSKMAGLSLNNKHPFALRYFLKTKIREREKEVTFCFLVLPLHSPCLKVACMSRFCLYLDKASMIITLVEVIILFSNLVTGTLKIRLWYHSEFGLTM